MEDSTATTYQRKWQILLLKHLIMKIIRYAKLIRSLNEKGITVINILRYCYCLYDLIMTTISLELTLEKMLDLYPEPTSRISSMTIIVTHLKTHQTILHTLYILLQVKSM